MNKNSQNRSFYYQDSTAGTFTLMVGVAPKPDSVSASCSSWSGASGSVVATLTQSITVGGSGQTQTQAQDQSQEESSSSNSQTQTQTQTAVSSGGSVPPPVSAQITLDGAAIAGGGAIFEGAAFDEGGDALGSGVRYLWNFGDGTTADGQEAQHTYVYPGKYVATLTVAYNYSSAEAELAVDVVQPAVSLTAEADGSLTILDGSADDLDIGGWSFTDGAHTFVIPADTMIMAGGGVRFAPGITGVVGGMSSALLYPNGTRAAGAQPSADSPLRGEQIAPAQIASEQPVSQTPSSPASAGIGASVQQVAPAPTQQSTSPQIENTDEQPDLGAAVQSAPASNALPLWLSIVGLLVLVVLGGGAVWYVQAQQAPARPAETSPAPDEFEIE
jgi:PKD domain